MAINCRFQRLPPPTPLGTRGRRPGCRDPTDSALGLGLSFKPSGTPRAPSSSLAPSMISLTPSHYFHEQLSFGLKPKATHVFRCPLCNVANLWLCIMYPGHGDFLTTSIPVWVLLKACNETYNLTRILLCFSCCFCFIGLC